MDEVSLWAAAEPPIRDARFRIEMTASCRDCDVLPRVPEAGSIEMRNGQRLQVMHNGLRVLAGAYHGTWMEEIIQRLGGHHEPQEELAFHTLLGLLGKRATMIELGAFWSYYSLWFLQGRHSERRCLAIEPDPSHLDVGRLNAVLNGAVVEFRQGFIAAVAHDTMPFATEDSGVVLAPALSARQLCQEWSPDGLDILHCDIQGAEIVVLRDCEDLLRSGFIKFAVVSTHAEMISGNALTHQFCLHFIERVGGRVLVEHDVHESYSGDGLIIAYFGKELISWPHIQISLNRYSTSLFRNPLYDLALSRAGKID